MGTREAVIPVAQARRFVLDHCVPLPPHATAAGESLGLVLANTVRASRCVPPFDNSAMDGYAVHAAETVTAPVRLTVIASVMAGDDSSAIVVGEGEAARIMTGAQMPRGADAVCMVERTRTELDGAIVVIQEAVERGANVRRAGEDIAAGTEVFTPGTLLTPPHLGVLASLGIETVVTHPAPRVAVISTGDELASSAGALAPGKIRDANLPSLLARLRADRFEPVDLGAVGDDEGALKDLLEEGGSVCDAVAFSGGVSVGDRDVAKRVLEEACPQEMRWMQVAVKPAKPFAFGLLASTQTPVFGLPGNPVSALVSYELFARPALRAMAGHRLLDRPRLTATAETDLPRRRDGKLHLLRASLRTGPNGLPRVRLSGGQDSHMLRAMADANALALLPDGDGVAAGEQVDVLILDAEGLCTPELEPAW